MLRLLPSLLPGARIALCAHPLSLIASFAGGHTGTPRPQSSAAAPPTLPLQLSPAAATRLSVLRAKAVAEGAPGGGSLRLRLRVDGGGCSGFRYVFELESPGAGPPKQGDVEDVTVVGGGGAELVTDAVSLGLLGGATVDYSESLMKASFVVVGNPQAESSCGCGSSFAAK